jgi:hypothetical protein
MKSFVGERGGARSLEGVAGQQKADGRYAEREEVWGKWPLSGRLVLHEPVSHELCYTSWCRMGWGYAGWGYAGRHHR